MNNNGRAGRTITRRAVVAGAAAGGLALAADPASAQRCPPAAPRTKGPAGVSRPRPDRYRRGLRQRRLRLQFEDHRRAPRLQQPHRAGACSAKPERVKYGPAEIERLDFYKAKQPNAPVLVFIHGGSWRGGRAEQFATYAEPFVKAGANFVGARFHQRARDRRRHLSDGRSVPARGGVDLPQRARASAAIPTRST